VFIHKNSGLVSMSYEETITHIFTVSTDYSKKKCFRRALRRLLTKGERINEKIQGKR
jgi:hypothetical protein